MAELTPTKVVEVHLDLGPLVQSLRDAADVLERYEMERQSDRRAAQALRAAHEQP
jgi:hypothetical protein